MLCICICKNYSTILDKGLRKNSNNKRDREFEKSKLSEMGALNMK